MEKNNKRTMIKTSFLLIFLIIGTLTIFITNVEAYNTRNETNNLGQEFTKRIYYIQIHNVTSNETSFKKYDFRQKEKELAERLFQRSLKHKEQINTSKNQGLEKRFRYINTDTIIENNNINNKLENLPRDTKKAEVHKEDFLALYKKEIRNNRQLFDVSRNPNQSLTLQDLINNKK